MMYVVGKDNAIIALDADHGQADLVAPGRGPRRPIAASTTGKARIGSDRRLIFAAEQLAAGDQRADRRDHQHLRQRRQRRSARGLGRDPKTVRNVQSGTPGRVFENLIILGSATGEGYGAPPGDMRAYDVMTGKLVWTFHTIPHPGEFGYDTWPKDAWKYDRRREHLGRDLGRREARHRLLPARVADLRLLRRGSQRREPVRQLPAGARCAHGQAALASTDRPPRSLGLRPDHRAEAADASGTTARTSTSWRSRRSRACSTSSIA